MCLLVVKPAGVELKDIDNLCKLSTEHNPDGFGLAYKGSTRIGTFRGLIKAPKQAEILKKIGKRPAIIHWRFGTGGGNTIHNCHPFKLQDGTVFAHNGIFPINPSKTQSDTRIIAENSRDLDELLFHVEPHIGAKNKIAYIRENDENPVILGETAGEWIEDCWYSNTYWKYSYSNSFTRYEDDGDYWTCNDLEYKLRPLINRYGIDEVINAAYKIDKGWVLGSDY